MIRALLAPLALIPALWPGPTLAQNLILASHLEITYSPRSCPTGQWCLSLQVVDAQTAQPLPSALLSTPLCGPVLADTAGRVQMVCAQAGRMV